MLIQDIQIIHEKGYAEVNEDAYVVSREHLIFAAIDGATGLGGLSGKLAAETIQKAVGEDGMSQSLWESVLAGNEHLGNRILESTGLSAIEEVKKESRSTCCIAAIKIDSLCRRFEYVHAGDCMIFLQYKDAVIRVLTHDYISPFDSVSISTFHNAMKSMVPAGVDPNKWGAAERQELISKAKVKTLPILKENRNKLNTIGGYGIIDGSPGAMDFLETGHCSLNRVEKILLLTDGLQLPNKKADGEENWLETAEFAFKHGLAALKDEVNRMEESDPACFTYPRLKPADDKTGILIGF